MLYLTKIDGINCTLFIDKKLKDGYTYPKMHCVKYRFSDELFEKETIFTGELVRDTERRWFFLIDNILLYRGMSTSDKNILSKFELIHSIMKNDYKPDRYLEICPIQIKKLFLYKDIKKMVEEFIPNLSYVCKGIIFYTLNNKHSNYAYVMPRDSQIQIKSSMEIDYMVQEQYPELWEKKNSIATEYLDESVSESAMTTSFQQSDIINTTTTTSASTGQATSSASGNEKQIEPNNVVFKVLKTEIPDIYNLYCYDDSHNLIKHSTALIPNIKISHYLYNTFTGNPNNLALKIECRYSKVFEKWTPCKFVDVEPYKQNVIDEIAEKLKNIN
jgi:hypothetical protein